MIYKVANGTTFLGYESKLGAAADARRNNADVRLTGNADFICAQQLVHRVKPDRFAS